jgi:SNF2 family DNA or RNA helicase
MTSPKAAMLAMLLERYEEAGRVVVYAGFQASVDMVEEECKKQDWSVFKADGRGWIGDEELLRAMDRSNPEYLALKQKYPKIAFIGHPKSAGMGLTLTSSPVVIYYSNDFNADDRVQSEARIHRAGMDTNTCPTIIDLVVLDTDTYVLKNLMTKRTLQGITLGQIEEEMKHLKLENVEVEDYNG